MEAEFDFDEVDASGLGDGPWYRSSVFEHDTFKFVNVNSAYFDGEVLVFDIHTM